jgi:hypothetical protein
MAYVARFDAEHAGNAPLDDAGNSHLHAVAESGAEYEVRARTARARQGGAASKGHGL